MIDLDKTCKIIFVHGSGCSSCCRPVQFSYALMEMFKSNDGPQLAKICVPARLCTRAGLKECEALGTVVTTRPPMLSATV